MLEDSEEAPTGRVAFSIAEFCKRNRISAPTFYKLKNAGRGPRIMDLGQRAQRISLQAEADWQRAMEAAANSEAAQLEKARRKAMATQGNKASVASPKRVSNRAKKKRAA